VPFIVQRVECHARKRTLRRNMTRATAHLGKFSDEIVALRKEIADLYDVPSFAHYVTSGGWSRIRRPVTDFSMKVKTAHRTELSDLLRASSRA